MEKRLISAPRSIVIAADVEGWFAETLAFAVANVKGISAFKFGIELGLDGLKRNVATMHRPDGNASKLAIYDHQKAGNDIPEMGGKFAKTLKNCGIDAAILFPFAGPNSQREWTKACVGEGLGVIVGGIMTHEGFLVSEGGYVADEAVDRIYENAMEDGVRNFVVPGTRLDWVIKLKKHFDSCFGEGGYDLFAPGFITQGGDISVSGRAAGPRFHAIVGGAIYGKDRLATSGEIIAAAQMCVNKL